MPEPDVLIPEEVRQQLADGSGLLKRYLHRHTSDPADAADLYQESILRVLEQARGRAIHNPIAYAFRVARNLIINRPRAEMVSSEELDELACHLPTPEDALNHSRNVEYMHQLLSTMPPLRREVLIRRRLHGESREHIAQALGLSEEAVKKHMTRALSDVQRFLDAQDAS